MSVINKMLRDLDQRQAPGTGSTDPLRRATASVAALPAPASSRSRVWLLGLLGAAVASAAGWWWWDGQQAASAPVAMPLPAPSVTAAASAPVPTVSAPVVEAPSATIAASAALVEASAPAAPPASTVVPAVPAQAAAPVAAPVPPPVKALSPAPASVGLRMESRLSSPGAAGQSSAAKADAATKPEPGAGVSLGAASSRAAAPAAEVSTPTRQLQASREALAQAQSLWASGARDTAISTLQEAVAIAERNSQTNNPGTLVPMVRELARMQLAEGQVAATWDLLVRMESLLANQPELWALRANAAQRLGRHQESVQAYNNALQSRPGEQRWLLGAAVSLAALGQTHAAADMAEKARSVGPVSRDVLAYLRQQGVPLTDRP